jgi:hypothetical protein
MYQASCDVQCPQRFAARGIGIAHCGQSFVVGAATGAGFAAKRLICLTTRKMKKATIRKLTTVFRNIP